MNHLRRDQDRNRVDDGRGVDPAGSVGLYRLELFHRATNAGPVAMRTIDAGILAIGRDETAAWSIPDPSRTLSRFHCEVSVRDGTVMLRSIGANGVFDETGARLPHGEAVRIAPPFTFTLGGFRIAVTENEAAAPVDLRDPTGFQRLPPSDDGGKVDPLVAAFCEGAGVDPAALAGVDPIRLMRRAGAMYRQSLVGICDLIVERDRARAHFRIAADGIGDAIANPFEWTPMQRLASDLLIAPSSDFLPGPAAIALSFDVIRRHLVATAAAHDAMVETADGDRGLTESFATTYAECDQRIRGAKPSRDARR